MLAAKKASRAEGATLKNFIRIIAELHKFQLLRGRAEGLADVDLLDLSAFLEGGASAPARALPSLKWFAKHASRAGGRNGFRQNPTGQTIYLALDGQTLGRETMSSRSFQQSFRITSGLSLFQECHVYPEGQDVAACVTGTQCIILEAA